MAMGITHGIFALLVGSAAHVILGTDPIASLAFALLGGLLPDIDHPKSIIGRKAKPISWLTTHRGFFHSLIGGVAITVILELVLRMLGNYNSMLPALFLLGYLSHLLLDGVTIEGVRFFYPVKMTARSKLKTGSAFEWVMSVVMIVVLVWYWFF